MNERERHRDTEKSEAGRSGKRAWSPPKLRALGLASQALNRLATDAELPAHPGS
jgi:hypothetical protein